jgi:phosphoserine phosphatase
MKFAPALLSSLPQRLVTKQSQRSVSVLQRAFGTTSTSTSSVQSMRQSPLSMSASKNMNTNMNSPSDAPKYSFSTAAAPNQHGTDVELAMHALSTADCVCFDVDSTVVNEEGIDVLADYLGKGQAVAALTLQAMEGGMKFQDALRARLELMQPGRPQIEQCLVERPLELTEGVHELVDKLHAAGKAVYLVSGGFRIMIEPVAAILGIDKSRIVANTIVFDEAGDYLNFDPNEPTSADMGKPAALRQIQEAGGYKTMVMVGDGATDAQAKPPAAAFIGFGGVAVRKQVQDTADWFVMDFKEMIRIVDECAGALKQN